MENLSQEEKALQLHQLHRPGKLLILPNIWDVLGAKLLEDLGYPAVATASAAIAFSNGYQDGEKIPFSEVLIQLERIAGSVNLPVTADIESGYADNEAQLRENISLLIKTGIVGINVEDTDHKTGSLYPAEVQSARIRLIRKVAGEMNVPLFINARADVLLYDNEFPTPASKYDELLRRGSAYKEAGANCFFPILLKQENEIQRLVTQLEMPVNILTLPGVPDLKTLAGIGVARISLGPSFLKIAIKAMKALALQLKDHEGLSAITENEITSDYLKAIIRSEK